LGLLRLQRAVPLGGCRGAPLCGSAHTLCGAHRASSAARGFARLGNTRPQRRGRVFEHGDGGRVDRLSSGFVEKQGQKDSVCFQREGSGRDPLRGQPAPFRRANPAGVTKRPCSSKRRLLTGRPPALPPVRVRRACRKHAARWSVCFVCTRAASPPPFSGGPGCFLLKTSGPTRSLFGQQVERQAFANPGFSRARNGRSKSIRAQNTAESRLAKRVKQATSSKTRVFGRRRRRLQRDVALPTDPSASETGFSTGAQAGLLDPVLLLQERRFF